MIFEKGAEMLTRRKSSMLILLGLIVLAALMFSQADKVRDSYSQPGEPKNAYLVHMMDRGINNLTQVMCSSEGQCVELTTAGMPMMAPQSIKVDGDIYFASLSTPGIDQIYAEGVYCAGAISTHGCFKLSVLIEGESCPESIEYLGFKAPLVKDSCIVE